MTILKRCDYPGCNEEVGFSGKGKGRARWGEFGRARLIQIPRNKLGLLPAKMRDKAIITVHRLCDGHYTSAKFVRKGGRK